MTVFDALRMAGSYFPDFDQSTCASLQLTTANARPPLFLPPTSASATSSLSKSHSPSLQAASKDESTSRKRLRRSDYTSNTTLTSRQSTPWSKIESPSAQSSTIYSPLPESPASFVNTRYRISGGLDTPLAARLEAEERHEEETRELDYRPSRMTTNARSNSAGYSPHTPATAAGGGHPGRKRSHSSDQTGWGRSVVNLVGGVAGKVFNFCWNSSFRGFKAGGGQTYMINSDTPPTIEQSTWMDVSEKDDVFNQHYKGLHYNQLTPIPGQFPEEGFIDDYMSHPQAYGADQLSTPVRHGDEGGSTLRRNWVLVNDTDGLDERHQSPILPPRTNAQAVNHQRRPTSKNLYTAVESRPKIAPSRPSLAGSPGANVKRPASFASPRASPGRSYAKETSCQSARGLGHRRSRSSMASPRRTIEVFPRQSYTPPTSPDVQRFEKKIRRKERKEEESMQRLNKQLQDMIKEGKEALGTRIEVEDETEEDEGYGEGTEIMGASKW
jgi:hypothetical protein